MNILLRTLIIVFGALFLPIAIVFGAHLQQHSVIFQVIQTQMVFDNSTIESATIISPKKSGDGYGVNLKLKAIAASKFDDLTHENLGKQANIVLNGKVISSATIRSKLGGKFFVTGLSKEQANQFIKSLQLTK